MRHFAIFALLMPCPALADQILATSHITAVTVFPQGAQVTRDVSFFATAGQHDLLITDMPAETAPDLIRMSSDLAELGAFALRTDRLPPRADATDPALLAAKAAMKLAEKDLTFAQSEIDAIIAKVDAADAQAAFLRGVKAEGPSVSVESVKGLAAMIGAEVLAARQTILAAKTAMPAAEQAFSDAQDRVDMAQAALDALSQRDQNYTALSVAIGMATAGDVHLTVSHFVQNASWQPVYDMQLVRKDTPNLVVKRGVLVSQTSGEDWAGVALTLSTAQPSTQAAPSELWPDLRQIIAKDDLAKGGVDMAVAEMAPTLAAPPESYSDSAEKPMFAQAVFEGDVVVYHYPAAVDVASGVENLRLALDELRFTPTIEARAVPRLDQTAFLVASFINESSEIFLPGQAYLMRDGTLVGSSHIDAIAPGDRAELAFGAIDGLRLSREMPVRAQGDRGIISTSQQITEKAVLKVENLTDEVWPVRLLDLVPYSEQEDLEISFAADPVPTETDVDGQRGVLAWTFDLAPGAIQEIALDHVLSWPDGQVLQ